MGLHGLEQGYLYLLTLLHYKVIAVQVKNHCLLCVVHMKLIKYKNCVQNAGIFNIETDGTYSRHGSLNC
jgi:hypothetical protein